LWEDIGKNHPKLVRKQKWMLKKVKNVMEALTMVVGFLSVSSENKEQVLQIFYSY
jgi:hypothetical protein